MPFRKDEAFKIFLIVQNAIARFSIITVDLDLGTIYFMHLLCVLERFSEMFEYLITYLALA